MHHASRLFVPCDLGFGTAGGPMFSTEIVATRGGKESRNQNWAAARFSFDLGLVTRPLSEWQAIYSAYIVCGGRADTFLFKDETDYAVTVANGYLRAFIGDEYFSNGVGYGLPAYELNKGYTFASVTKYRPIRAPVSPAINRGGSPVTVGVSPGNISISGGVVTFVADQSRVINSHTTGLNHQLVVASAFSPNFAVGGRVYITGVTGSAASVLNGKSHAIGSASGATLTLGTSTNGLTASGGTAYFYPQPTESLLWSGDFDLKVRFDTDTFSRPIINRNGAHGELLLEMPSCPIIEVDE